jgi:tRNA nucleotidyltransferase (CCA-adding enzyme)
MKDALDVVMAWQLRNPESADADAAIEAVRASRAQTDSELPSRLASHFLQLTIPPFFPQNKSGTNALEASRQGAPWKECGAQYVLELLTWSIGALSRKEKEARWHLLVPPILKMIDDMDAAWKAKGCHILGILLESLHHQPWIEDKALCKTTDRQTSTDFLQRTGYQNVFSEALLPLFTYVPSLTPEAEAVPLFKELFPALTTLGLLLPAESSKGSARSGLLDKVVREGVFAPLAHFSTPSAYPELATVIVSHLEVLLGHMGIESVKHLPNVIPLLSKILGEPFVVSHRGLAVSTVKTMQAVMLNAWPRLGGHRGEIMMGLCLCWGRCTEETSSDVKHVGEVKKELQETVAMLDAVMQVAEDASVREKWKEEKLELVETCATYKGLFVGCAGDSVESSVS